MDMLLDLDQDTDLEDDIALLEDQINDELAEIEDQNLEHD
jgi:hypothetical protein